MNTDADHRTENCKFMSSVLASLCKSSFVADPCLVYNNSLRIFEQTCDGGCLLADSGEGLCCNSIECGEDDVGAVCGSDGNNYESECALKR